jgi:hypothetical protein
MDGSSRESVGGPGGDGRPGQTTIRATAEQDTCSDDSKVSTSHRILLMVHSPSRGMRGARGTNHCCSSRLGCDQREGPVKNQWACAAVVHRDDHRPATTQRHRYTSTALTRQLVSLIGRCATACVSGTVRGQEAGSWATVGVCFWPNADSTNAARGILDGAVRAVRLSHW